jgi:hypothetical protein
LQYKWALKQQEKGKEGSESGWKISSAAVLLALSLAGTIIAGYLKTQYRKPLLWGEDGWHPAFF